MHRFKVLTMSLIMAAAFGIAGCGGGGGGTADTTDPPVTVPDPAIAQRAAIQSAIDEAQTAVAAVDNDSTPEEVSAADAAITAARGAITAAAAVPAEEKAANTRTVDALASQLSDATTARQAAMDEADMAENAAMAVTAAKLYAGIVAPTDFTSAPGRRHAAYNDDDTRILVSIGDDNTGLSVGLVEDKSATVADNHGWQGKNYKATRQTVIGTFTYEAYVYSNVGEATEGDPFNDEYTLNNDGELAIDTSTEAVQARVASPNFDQSAGTKMFKLPTNDGTNPTSIRPIAGSYHGVSGYYHCTPGQDQTCSSTLAAKGFTLSGGTWTFKPSNPEAKVTSTPDTTYASYGWWLRKSADGETFDASAFADEKGTVPAAAGITALRGTATYTGGAAGKYALRSSTGGTNDAGHFTARATLEADFNDDMITGTIDNFIGADGQSRDWSVELKETAVGDTGAITQAMTAWTIDGTAAADSGQWTGSLRDNGADSVPKVGTGTFYTEYGGDGKMVGAFGVNKQ